jgi:hypothetical protein
LYRNDGSKQALWTVDWYAEAVQVADDGVHVMELGGWPFKRGRDKPLDADDLKQKAFAIHASGKLVREYTIGELVDQPQLLPRSVSHFRWMKSAAFEATQVNVVTHDGNRVVIELKTGKIVSKKAEAKP